MILTSTSLPEPSLTLQILRVMRHFPPETRVMTAVRMSKASYARLLSTRYTPDTRTGWAIPHPTHQDYKSHDIGMKLVRISCLNQIQYSIWLGKQGVG